MRKSRLIDRSFPFLCSSSYTSVEIMLFLAPVSHYHHHHHRHRYYYYFVIRFVEYRDWELGKFRRYENTFVNVAI